jgi:competence protein ComEC
MSSTALTIKKIPFVRLLIFLMVGIIMQWYLQFSIASLLIAGCVCLLLIILFYFLPSSKKFMLRWFQGIVILFLFGVAGAIITYTKDIRHHQNWVGKVYLKGSLVKATIEEPLVNKDKSYKALASVDAIKTNGIWKSAEGKILVYFKKDSTAPFINYGSQIIFKKPLQIITNSGNPGAFDYNRFCLFQDVQHQVFLQTNDFKILPDNNGNWLTQLLFNIRNSAIAALQKNIPNEKEQGVAEALLIGYRDDLDKSLVQAYSNTGVVHIIAPATPNKNNITMP